MQQDQQRLVLLLYILKIHSNRKPQFTLFEICNPAAYISARMQCAGWVFALSPCILEIHSLYILRHHFVAYRPC